MANSWLDRFLEDPSICVCVSIHESERKYIKVERISFYKLNFEVRPEIKLKGIRSCIVMDYKAWDNGGRNGASILLENLLETMSSDPLTISCRDPREKSLFLPLEREVNDVVR